MRNAANNQSLLIQNAGASPLFPTPGAVRCENGRITEIAPSLRARPGEKVIDANGHALIPGLHDHHIHLLATAAARASLDCGDYDQSSLPQRLATDPTTGWLRCVNYNESIAGELDRHILDRWVGHRPVRIQHSTGQMWFLNSPAIEALGLTTQDHAGIERDAAGSPTGRLFRADALLQKLWQRERIAPNLGELSRDLAGYGVTGVTDTSHDNNDANFELLHEKQRSGELLQRVRLMGNATLGPRRETLIATGELKILLDEAALPDLDELIERVQQAHSAGRSVALHCVTRIELAIVLNVFETVGCLHDRIEHASVVPANTLEQISALGLQVVTQPGLIHERGDRYLRELSATELSALYRLQTLHSHQIPLAGSSDAPYGPLNPWLGMHCSVNRNTASGQHISKAEGLTPEQALFLYCGPPEAPSRARRLATNQPADLAILNTTWEAARLDLQHVTAEMTLLAGQRIPGAELEGPELGTVY